MNGANEPPPFPLATHGLVLSTHPWESLPTALAVNLLCSCCAHQSHNPNPTDHLSPALPGSIKCAKLDGLYFLALPFPALSLPRFLQITTDQNVTPYIRRQLGPIRSVLERDGGGNSRLRRTCEGKRDVACVQDTRRGVGVGGIKRQQREMGGDGSRITGGEGEGCNSSNHSLRRDTAPLALSPLVGLRPTPSACPSRFPCTAAATWPSASFT